MKIFVLQVLSKISEAGLKRRSHCSTFPVLLDDIDFKPETKKQLIDYYTGIGEQDAKAAYKNNCGLMISSNNLLEEDSGRYDYI